MFIVSDSMALINITYFEPFFAVQYHSQSEALNTLTTVDYSVMLT